MATILRTPTLLSPAGRSSICLEFVPRAVPVALLGRRPRRLQQLNLTARPRETFRFLSPPPLAAFEEATETGATVETTAEESLEVESTAEIEDGDGAVPTEDEPASPLVATLQAYKEALLNGDQPTVTEIETFLQSIEDEKISLSKRIAILSDELSTEKERVLRISADFDNFRKRTERERLSLMTNAQGEVVESLLPVLDNFERAKAQIKVETEGEEKINNSYQSIYKQFVEILTSLGVEAVETVGTAFDPMLHEAIMREDSDEFEEGIILQEFRKGFKLGDRLLRPSMVKVSAGPGPAKPPAQEEEDGSPVTSQGSSSEAGDAV